MRKDIKSCCSRSPIRRLAAALLAAALVLCTSGCASASAGRELTLRIGAALYNQEDTFIKSITRELESLAQDAEAERGVRINVSFADAAGNQTTQIDQVDRFISLGFDILCVNIVDRTAASVLVDKAEQAELPLIFFNRQPVAEDIDYRRGVYYVGADAAAGGTLQGELVLEAWQTRREELDRNGDGVLQYVLLEGEPGHQDSLLRTEYALKALGDAGVEVECLAGAAANWNRGQAALRMQEWLDAFGDGIEAVISNNDDMALGAIDVLRDREGTPPLVFGVDATAPALEAVERGEMYGTVLNDAKGIAGAMLDLALALSEGRDPSQDVELSGGRYVWLPYKKVTSENLGDFSDGEQSRP